MAGNGNGSTNSLLRALAPILIALTIGGGALVQGQAQNNGVSDRMLEVIATLERMEAQFEDGLRRIENAEDAINEYRKATNARLAIIETQAVLIAREDAALWELVQDVETRHKEIDESMRKLEKRVQFLEYGRYKDVKDTGQFSE